ncbi:3-dehydroquinate synthase [candidate division WOR-1 bacterium RIFOXYB2_FULL_48_7]|uniref:3-dehydroquinate synthase n=1 Tax=candidate division WOR-1 bacterium RIFOXYB2_FULL_48_7 TaxID=1802583 RepID=A0A1F4TI00_UNCSA|nr:MAG: 3-dehydroquinate synthase [candidate division WOR-1 bacterium RIFOXYB2_FULL_48_7]
MAKIKVDLDKRSYEIIVGIENLNDLGKLIEEQGWGKEIILITDPLVNDLYGQQVLKGLRHRTKVIEVPRGERYKNIKECSRIFDELAKYGAHRDCLVIALGGGVIGDLAGYVAASYMRGVNYIQVPTTLLAQVDSAIGGKTGINHPKCKNMIGAFWQPKLVCIDVKTLTTLPARELRTGLAEVVKYGVIKDEAFFVFLEENAHHLNTKAFEDPQLVKGALKLWQTIVTESAKIKAAVVEKDETEAGLRMILNFGHTIGHALETLTSYDEYNHGEAVAIGMVAATVLAHKLGSVSETVVIRVKNLLDKLGLPVEIKRLSAKKLISAMEIDKKATTGRLRFVLPEKIGKVIIRDDVPLKTVRQALEEIGAR